MARIALRLLLPLLIIAALDCAAQRPPTGDTNRLFVLSGHVRYADNSRAVEMLRVDLKLFTGETVASTFTGTTGDFEIRGLKRGTYFVIVEEDGFEPIRESVEILNADRRGILLYLKKPLGPPPETPASATVSARELSLPPKAVEAYQKGYQRLHEKRDPEGSLSHFRRAVKLLPDYYEAYYQMGVSYLQLGEEKDAEKAFRHSIEHGKDTYAEPYFGLAAIECNQKKFAECTSSARRGMNIDPNAWRGHYQLARGLVGLNRLAEAEEHLRVVTQQQPDFAEPYLVYANICIRRNDLPALLHTLDEYLRLEPKGPMSDNVRQTRDAVQKDLEAQTKPKP